MGERDELFGALPDFQKWDAQSALEPTEKGLFTGAGHWGNSSIVGVEEIQEVILQDGRGVEGGPHAWSLQGSTCLQ